MGESRKPDCLSNLSRFSVARWILPLLVVVVLYFEIIGIGAGLSYSLGEPISAFYAMLPIQFVAVTSRYLRHVPYLSFALLSSSLIVGVIGHILVGRKQTDRDSVEAKASRTRLADYLILLSALSIAGVLVWLPRSLQTLPIGSDTLYYISVLDTMKAEGAKWAIIYTDKPLFYLMLLGLDQLSGLSTVDFFRVLPVLLAIGMVAGAWFFVRSFYQEAAGFAALLTAISTTLMRTSIDLYASFFAVTLFLFTMGVYVKNRDANSILRLVVLQLLLVVLLMSYWFLWLFVLMTLAAAEISSKQALRGLKLMVPACAPSILVIGLFVVTALANPPPAYWGLGSSFELFLGRTITPAGLYARGSAVFDTSGLALLGQDNLIIPILAALGLVFLRLKSFAHRTLYLWSSTMLVLSLVAATGTHAALLFPLPTLAGIGLRKLVERL